MQYDACSLCCFVPRELALPPIRAELHVSVLRESLHHRIATPSGFFLDQDTAAPIDPDLHDN